ncbi:hypothetical protein OIU78_004552 [Salix suchowensis]|nr:hypothetical protein OIU78_004552 [Salix suchowensis]
MSTVTTLPTIPVPLNSTALYAALSSTPTSLPHLKQFHAHVLRSDLPPSLILKLLLSSPSFSSSSLDYALSVFTHLPTCHTPLSNKLLRSLSRSAKPENALLAYEKMRLKEGLLGIDRFSFPPLLKAASRASGLNEGKEIHGVAAKLGFDKDPFVQTGLVGIIRMDFMMMCCSFLKR